MVCGCRDLDFLSWTERHPCYTFEDFNALLEALVWRQLVMTVISPHDIESAKQVRFIRASGACSHPGSILALAFGHLCAEWDCVAPSKTTVAVLTRFCPDRQGPHAHEQGLVVKRGPGEFNGTCTSRLLCGYGKTRPRSERRRCDLHTLSCRDAPIAVSSYALSKSGARYAPGAIQAFPR